MFVKPFASFTIVDQNEQRNRLLPKHGDYLDFGLIGQPFRFGQAVAGIILREPGDIQRMPDAVLDGLAA